MRRFAIPTLGLLVALPLYSTAAQTKWIYKNPSTNSNVGTLVDDSDSSRIIKDVRLASNGATTIWLYSNGSTSGLGDLDFSLPVESEDGSKSYTIAGFGSSCFSGNRTVTSVVFPSTLTTISQELFRNCTALTNVVFPAGLTAINSQSFSGCTSLASIPAFPATLTTLGDNCFNGCSSLAGDIVLPDGVTTCNSSFRYAKLTSIRFGSGMRLIGNESFRSMTTLTNVYFDAATSLSSIGASCFQDCTALACDLGTLPRTLTTLGNNAFYNCKLAYGDVVLPDGVSTVGNTFRYCAITSFKAGSGLATIGNSSFQSMTTLTNLDLSAATGLSSIGTQGFSDCTGMVFDLGTLPRTLTTLGNNAFYNCKLAYGDVVLPDGVTSVNNTFRFCAISSFTAGAGLASIGGDAFRQMNSLLHVDLTPATNLTSIGSCCFQDDTGITNDIAIALPATLTTLGNNAFFNCTKLVGDVVLPDGVSSVQNTFRYCAISSFTAGRGLSTITTDAFRQMPSLLSVDLSPATNLTSIGNGCFQDDTGITNAVVFPRKLGTLGSMAFYNCNKMEGDLVIPETVTNIQNHTFAYAKLRSVTALGARTLGQQCFRGMPALERLELGWDLDTLVGTETLRDDSKLKAIYWRSPPTIANSSTKPMGEWDWRVNGCTNYIPWDVRANSAIQSWQNFATEYAADYGTILDENGEAGLPTKRDAVGTMKNKSRTEVEYIAYWLPDLNPATLVLVK